ncbi:MAG TPA: hypothetical protein DCW87_00720 [Comamonadaceae bacterium]|nr:hypothetical protein [Comamonadaceae bacterium]
MQGLVACDGRHLADSLAPGRHAAQQHPHRRDAAGHQQHGQGRPEGPHPVIHPHQHHRVPGQGQKGGSQKAVHLEKIAVRKVPHQRQQHHQAVQSMSK